MKKKFIMIMLFLISLFIIVPNNVRAFDLNNVKNNSLFILKEPIGADIGEKFDTTTTTDKYLDNVGVSDVSKTFCDDDLKKAFKTVYQVLLTLAPALLIFMTIIDFFKAIVSSDAEKIKKSSGDALKRTLAFVILLLLAFILRTIFGWIGLKLCM